MENQCAILGTHNMNYYILPVKTGELFAFDHGSEKRTARLVGRKPRRNGTGLHDYIVEHIDDVTRGEIDASWDAYKLHNYEYSIQPKDVNRYKHRYYMEIELLWFEVRGAKKLPA